MFFFNIYFKAETFLKLLSAILITIFLKHFLIAVIIEFWQNRINVSRLVQVIRYFIQYRRFLFILVNTVTLFHIKMADRTREKV